MQHIKEKSLRSLMIILIIGVLVFTGKALLAEEALDYSNRNLRLESGPAPSPVGESYLPVN